jgi:hypothetical protein
MGEMNSTTTAAAIIAGAIIAAALLGIGAYWAFNREPEVARCFFPGNQPMTELQKNAYRQLYGCR